MATHDTTTPRRTFTFSEVAGFEEPLLRTTEACRAAMLIAWHGEHQGLTEEDAGGLRFVLDAAIEQLKALQDHFRAVTSETEEAANG